MADERPRPVQYKVISMEKVVSISEKGQFTFAYVSRTGAQIMCSDVSLAEHGQKLNRKACSLECVCVFGAANFCMCQSVCE